MESRRRTSTRQKIGDLKDTEQVMDTNGMREARDIDAGNIKKRRDIEGMMDIEGWKNIERAPDIDNDKIWTARNESEVHTRRMIWSLRTRCC